ncbi:hypothetical protein PSP6_270032 [Paraburkholderia tropica]|nr:hypothetical protein PSP6_270032 [Paraburkholderia tropica]
MSRAQLEEQPALFSLEGGQLDLGRIHRHVVSSVEFALHFRTVRHTKNHRRRHGLCCAGKSDGGSPSLLP